MSLKTLLTRILEALSVDYVVEQGTYTSGTTVLTWRKWASGIAQCWGRYSKSINANTVDNNNYIGFPFAFTETPCITIGLSAGGAKLYYAHIEHSTNTTQVRLTIINEYTSAVGMTVNVDVKGRWK